ncbi:MAG: transglycosylase domain-containing protein [Bryobacteraceae bacterium]
MSIVLERRASKDEILELYLNDVYLGQRGSFGIHGVAEASRIFFGKDVSNVTIAEAAVIAMVRIIRPAHDLAPIVDRGRLTGATASRD